jgi:hypothetical protein
MIKIIRKTPKNIATAQLILPMVISFSFSTVYPKYPLKTRTPPKTSTLHT